MPAPYRTSHPNVPPHIPHILSVIGGRCRHRQLLARVHRVHHTRGRLTPRNVQHRRQNGLAVPERGLTLSSHAVRSALGGSLTELLNAQDPVLGTINTKLSRSVSTRHSGPKMANCCCAQHGKEKKAVPEGSAMLGTSAQGVVQSAMEPSNALVHRRVNSRAEVWGSGNVPVRHSYLSYHQHTESS